jgi:hypothetical protein
MGHRKSLGELHAARVPYVFEAWFVVSYDSQKETSIVMFLNRVKELNLYPQRKRPFPLNLYTRMLRKGNKIMG